MGCADQPSAGDIGLEFSSGTEGEHIGAKPNIARGQCQHVPSLWRTGDEADHPRAIEARDPVCADVHSAGIADWFSIEQYRDGCTS